MLCVALALSCEGGCDGGDGGGNTCICNCYCRKKRDVATIPESFSDYDTDQNGVITNDEFAKVLNMDEKEAQEYFEIIDLDENGKTTLDEFQMIKKLKHIIYEVVPRV